MEIVSEVSKPLQEIADIHRLGRGSFTNGFLAMIGGVIETGFKAAGSLFNTAGKAISNIISHMASGSADIIQSSSGGVAEIINSTGDALNTVEAGISDILVGLIGGILPIANSAAILAMIIYLFYKEKRTDDKVIQRFSAGTIKIPLTKKTTTVPANENQTHALLDSSLATCV